MLTDIFGNTVSLNNTDARDAWDKMQLAFLSHAAATPTHLGAVLNAEPHFALGQAVKGLFYLMLGRRELVQTAQEALVLAKSAAQDSSVTYRETCFIDALEFWLRNCPRAARDRIESVLRIAPEDALAMKVSQAISFILGDAKEMRTSLEEILPHYHTDHAAYGYLHGCYAFALEETGEYQGAEISGKRGMEHAPNDAWGLHAVAHVYDMTANAAAGLSWLKEREEAWSHCNNFKYHVWWHKALMHLELNQKEEALALYDSEIRREKTDDYRDISNATSLLKRLELEDVNVGHRWNELADICQNRTEDGCLIFADLHYLLALTGAERPDAVRSIISRIRRDAEGPPSDLGEAMKSPGIAAAIGLEAFGESNYEVAFRSLAKARNNMQMAGGSHAQRDIFERLTIDAGIRAGFFEEAREILDQRKSQRGGAEDQFASVRYDAISSNSPLRGTGQQVAAE